MYLIKNILTLIVLAVILYAAYYFLFSDRNPDLTSSAGANDGEMLASEFLMRLNEIETLSFSRGFFDDPRFRSLVSFSSAPADVSVGRPNPFAN
jgi:hypothetical protein